MRCNGSFWNLRVRLLAPKCRLQATPTRSQHFHRYLQQLFLHLSILPFRMGRVLQRLSTHLLLPLFYFLFISSIFPNLPFLHHPLLLLPRTVSMVFSFPPGLLLPYPHLYFPNVHWFPLFSMRSLLLVPMLSYNCSLLFSSTVSGDHTSFLDSSDHFSSLMSTFVHSGLLRLVYRLSWTKGMRKLASVGSTFAVLLLCVSSPSYYALLRLSSGRAGPGLLPSASPHYALSHASFPRILLNGSVSWFDPTMSPILGLDMSIFILPDKQLIS